MRKLSLLISSCVAVVVLAAFGAPAFAATVVDPSCDLDHPEWGDGVPGPYNNDFAVRDFRITTTNNVEHAVAGVTGHFVACGTQISGGPGGGVFPGQETLNNHAELTEAPGVAINSTAGMPAASYVGTGDINAAGWVTSTGRTVLLAKNQHFNLRTDVIAACEAENDQLVGGPHPGTIVACYQARMISSDPLTLLPAHSWNWVTENGGSYTLTIGPFYNDLTAAPGGLTAINLATLCAYAGATGSQGTDGTCGEDAPGGPDPTKWLQKNGDYSSTILLPEQWPPPPPPTVPYPNKHGCYDGYGVYKATATNFADETTAPASWCVLWVPRPHAMPHP